MARSVIIGAGIAGLTAGYTLQRLGESNPPLVVEKNPFAGGLASTMEWQGCRMDLGPHRIYTVYPHAKELIHSLVGDDLVVCKRTSQIFLSGKWLDYPPRVGELISRLGPLVGLRLFFSALSGRLQYVMHRISRKSTHSYGEYLQHRFGKALRGMIFDPFALKVYREEPDDLDEMVARVRLASQGLFSTLWEALTGRRTSAVKSFLYPRYGIGLISARLAERIQSHDGEVLLSHKVTKIRHTGGLVRSVEIEDDDGMRIQVDSSRVISTIPLAVLVELLEPNPPLPVNAAADSLTYADSFLVYTLVNRQPLTNNCWMYFPGEETIFTRVYELYHFCPELVPEGMSCLCAEIPARPTDPVQYVDDTELMDRVWDGFKRTGMAQGAERVDQVVLKVPYAYPIYRLGYRQELQQVLDYLSGFGNLISTGRHGLFHYNNSDHSMEMGRLAAEYAFHFPDQSQGWYARREEFDAYRIVD
ncbi:MAG: FAD-dependent oxidoreductase [Candidatus Omnitrophica bacterium]|nr:FAD-dependent oxidoreductase [Candidatus Omnitrophota bacterium]